MSELIAQVRCASYRFWQENPMLTALFLVSLLLDAMSTVYFMQLTGPYSEFHPLVRAASMRFGVVSGPLLGAICKLIAAVAIVCCYRSVSRHIMTLATAIYFFAAAYNALAYDLYVLGVVSWLPF